MIKYDIAISFAGENRKIAEILAKSLQNHGYKVFYDDFEKAELWGKDLSVELPRRYEQSRFCIMLISGHYLKKMWTTLERQVVIRKFLESRGNDYLLPVRLDGCKAKVPGLSELVGYININTKDTDELIRLTKELLDKRS